MTSAKGIGIPIKLMHESEGHVITVSLSQLQVLLGSIEILLCIVQLSDGITSRPI